jgi:hypothetical protein
MKTYKITLHFNNGKDMKLVTLKQKKRVDDKIEAFKKNRLIDKITLLTQEYGEYENAGEYTESSEVVYEKNRSAQALGKLSAQARDTSSEAMRELVNKRWNK